MTRREQIRGLIGPASTGGRLLRKHQRETLNVSCRDGTTDTSSWAWSIGRRHTPGIAPSLRQSRFGSSLRNCARFFSGTDIEAALQGKSIKFAVIFFDELLRVSQLFADAARYCVARGTVRLLALKTPPRAAQAQGLWRQNANSRRDINHRPEIFLADAFLRLCSRIPLAQCGQGRCEDILGAILRWYDEVDLLFFSIGAYVASPLTRRFVQLAIISLHKCPRSLKRFDKALRNSVGPDSKRLTEFKGEVRASEAFYL